MNPENLFRQITINDPLNLMLTNLKQNTDE